VPAFARDDVHHLPAFCLREHPMKLALMNAANWLLHGLHLAVLGWNVFGWMYRPWWPWHRLCVALTLASWMVLGLIVGRLGYCVLTDWHWQIRAALGARDLPNTYIAFLLHRAGISARPRVVSRVTSVVFIAICAVAAVEWWVERLPPI
jgi:hypothetical protein